jgi:uncharacterized membrane protein
MSALIHRIFGLVCAQNPAHTWAPGGDLLPVCQRCTGLYVGALLALLLLLCFRPATNERYRRLHVILVLLMTPFGFHLVPHGAVLRTMSGNWFGFGVVGLLWLLPEKWIAAKTGRLTSGLKPYLLLGGASIVLLPLLVIWAGSFAWLVLPWLALAGMAVIAGLLVGNTLIFAVSIFRWLCRPVVSPIS